ncbi:hypothetical protein AAHA92_19445 [Salvia divinorum]|uniref:TRF2/HOY1 PH-like domain-containing protein n=1 Tax=Salvia divinorum TaxID=28513 RepID=A0ABD1H5V0_SALDI
MEEDSNRTKRPYALEETRPTPPVGFRPVDTKSFRKSVESTRSKPAAGKSQHDKDMKKASNVPTITLTVGNWKREAVHRGSLTTKIYYGKKKLVWEFLYGELKSKMEVSWSDITAIEAVMNPNQPGFLRVQLAKPPLFFREIPPQPKKHSNWEKADDFTNGQALFCMTHEATFQPGVLDKHYEKLLINDERLAELSRRPFPTHESVLPFQQQLLSSVLPSQKIPQQQILSSALSLEQIPQQQILSSALSLQQIPQQQILSSALSLQQIPRQQFLSSALPLQQIPQQQQLHHSLNSNIIAATAPGNSVMAARGNRIDNEPTFAGSSIRNPIVVSDRQQQLRHSPYIAPSASSNGGMAAWGNQINNNEPTCMGSLSQKPRVDPDQHHYQYNDMAVNNQPAFVGSSSQNPFVAPASTYADQSLCQYSSVVPDQHLYECNDMAAPFIPPQSSCLPRFMQQGPSEAQYLVQNGANADEEAIATCDDEPWSLVDLYTKQSQEYHCNGPVGGGNVNEASSVSPAPASCQDSSVVTDDHNDIHVDRYRCLPVFMRQGLSEAQYLAQNADEEANATCDEEENATCDDEPWSLLDLYIKAKSGI